MESRQSQSRPYEHALIRVETLSAEDVLEMGQPEAVVGVRHSCELGDDGQLSVLGD